MFSSNKCLKLKLTVVDCTWKPRPARSYRFLTGTVLKFIIRYAYAPSSASNKQSNCMNIFSDSAALKHSRFPFRQNVEMELVLYETSRACGRLFEVRRDGVSETANSVPPERDFSVVRYVFGERRARLCTVTLDKIFILKRATQHPVYFSYSSSIPHLSDFITALSERCS